MEVDYKLDSNFLKNVQLKVFGITLTQNKNLNKNYPHYKTDQASYFPPDFHRHLLTRL